MTGPYGVADYNQPLTDFEKQAGVLDTSTPAAADQDEPVTPSDHANQLIKNVKAALTAPATVSTDDAGQAGRVIVFRSVMARTMAEHAIAAHAESLALWRDVSDLVSLMPGWNVTEVIPLQEDGTPTVGAYLVRTEKDRNGARPEMAFRTVVDGRDDRITWPTRIGAMIHLAARMSDPADRGDDGRAAVYASRMIGHTW